MLPPSAIAGVSLACAFAPWVFTAPAVLRVFAALAAAVAIVGAAVMRRWDMYAGKQVADLARARASDEWRSEERIAELESDLDESRDLRGKLEQRLRAKRAELAGLRNEHAALLRRYATAETERATALEGRRLLEIEAAPDPEPPAGTTAAGAAVDAGSAAAPVAEAAAETGAVAASGAADGDGDGDEGGTPAVFSPEGSRLFLRAEAAMLRLAGDSAADGSGHGSVDASDGPAGGASDGASDSAETADGSEAAETVEAAEKTGTAGTAEAVEAPEGSDAPEAAEAVEDGGDGDGPDGGGGGDGAPKGEDGPRDGAAPAHGATVKVGAPRGSVDAPEGAPVPAGATVAAANAEPTEDGEAGATGEADGADGAEGKAVAVEGHARATAAPARTARNQRAGHFVAPTAVAVVPGSPARRPSVEGGFDFFGTKAEDADGHSDGATDADTEGEPAGAEGAGHGEGPHGTAEATVRNEDLADVVGQEALALHKAEAESGFKPADEEARGAGQVIDLTAHDETEHIDLDGLRSAVS
ncbi:hypothetical protein RM863_32880 [Streptomyces sp. DSM 41014]|uniref:Secreted protein n=1 Tax=Streptomyces hintoniae TaxID=3075521 RepID=A0ABU2UUG3_9ACTN|nr:hypothetical protein [Streptomyces sp. DSM 41014]MDT0476925.1 hypothetical protein [Streptomyces sp. DSM 41014]